MTKLNSDWMKLFEEGKLASIHNISVNFDDGRAAITATLYSGKGPRDAQELSKMIAQEYLSSRGIDYDIDDLIKKVIPEEFV